MLFKTLFSVLLSVATLTLANGVSAHCQVPCGIYDDHVRVELMLEDVTTIEKAVKMINELSGKTDSQSMNQLVRWINNKEKHAQNIIDIISDYFLTQRIKPSQKDYDERLKKHHAIIIAAMKAKQNAGKKADFELRKAVDAIADYYPPHKH